jgi:hypothetical protein
MPKETEHTDQLPGGLADKKTPADFDEEDLGIGINVELEHVKDRKIAREIAMDHLTEDPDYYTKLKRVEKAFPFPLNLKKGRKLRRRMKFQGMDVSIETDKGEYRHWYDPHNKTEGKTKMTHPYGYIRRTDGADGEQVDIYVGPNEDAKKVYVVHQMKAPEFKQYDEDKVMAGFDSAKEAKAAYMRNFDDTRFFGAMTAMPVERFRDYFIKKALTGPPTPMTEGEGEPPEQGAPPPQKKGPPGVADPMLAPPPLDLNNLEHVMHMLSQIASINDKDLEQLSQEVWGEGYTYNSLSDDHAKAELIGWLLDQRDLLAAFPIVPQTGMQPFPPAASLPHSQGQPSPSMPGQPNASVPSPVVNSSGEESVSRPSTNSSASGLFSQLGMDPHERTKPTQT